MTRTVSHSIFSLDICFYMPLVSKWSLKESIRVFSIQVLSEDCLELLFQFPIQRTKNLIGQRLNLNPETVLGPVSCGHGSHESHAPSAELWKESLGKRGRMGKFLSNGACG